MFIEQNFVEGEVITGAICIGARNYPGMTNGKSYDIVISGGGFDGRLYAEFVDDNGRRTSCHAHRFQRG